MRILSVSQEVLSEGRAVAGSVGTQGTRKGPLTRVFPNVLHKVSSAPGSIRTMTTREGFTHPAVVHRAPVVTHSASDIPSTANPDHCHPARTLQKTHQSLVWLPCLVPLPIQRLPTPYTAAYHVH